VRPPQALLIACSVSSLLAACKPAPAHQEASSDRQAARQIESAGNESLAVSGLRGTLSQEEIRRALEPKLPRFLRCAAARLGELEVLSGSLTFSFHIALNGSVAAAQPSQSTLGDRATERCMLEVAEATRFPPPHGGEADFTWPLELPLDPEVRAPVELSADFALVPALPTPRSKASAPQSDTARAASLQASCGGPEYTVTAYLDPNGGVLAAGVATPDPVTAGELDCIAEGVQQWTFSSPGSYVGKLAFTVP
jgi:hypothetical protein